MARSTIRRTRLRNPKRESDVWLARAARARHIATMLSKADAAIALAHAAECEAEAMRLLDQKQPQIAA